MVGYPKTFSELEARFATQARCRDYIARLRWPRGFRCPRPYCEGRKAWRLKNGLWLCQRCRKQISPACGAQLHDSRLPLPLWFKAIWLVSNEPDGISALELKNRLNLKSYQTAWGCLNKIRRHFTPGKLNRLYGPAEMDVIPVAAFDSRKKQCQPATVLLIVQRKGASIGRIRFELLNNTDDKSLVASIKAKPSARARNLYGRSAGICMPQGMGI